MSEDKSLKDEVKELKELMTQVAEVKKPKEKKPREFKIPGIGRVSGSRTKKNWITVMEINENHGVRFSKQQIQEQTLMIDGVPRIATPDNILMHNNKPIVVLPKWSVKPLSPSDRQYDFFSLPVNYQEVEKKGLNIKGYKVLMDRLKNEAIKSKKSMPWWIWIVVLGVVGVAAYFLLQK